MAAPVTEHPDYLRVVAINRSDLAERAACEALADVVATTDDPLVALYASAMQIGKTREQGTHEAAVLLLAETLDRIDGADFTRATLTFKRDVMIGLANGVSSALDVAEV